MISHESPSDLIAAEIEAIIQEEINSQISPELTEESDAGSEQVSNLDVEESVAAETAPIEATVSKETIETPVNEDESTTEAKTFIEESNENVVEAVENEDFIDYTVKIGSPSQESVSIPEVEESLCVVPLIDTILKDAPIDENDGPRSKHLKQALRKALNNTVKSCSGDKLETCFPFNLKGNQFSKINSTILNGLQSVIEGVQGPFDEFLKSENLVDKLNKVDEFSRSRIPGTSESSDAAHLSSLTPQDLIDRKLFKTKLAALNKLEQYTQKLEAENSQLAKDLNNRQADFADRLDRLKTSQQVLDSALDQISTLSMDDLEVLVDKMNHQYQPGALKIHH